MTSQNDFSAGFHVGKLHQAVLSGTRSIAAGWPKGVPDAYKKDLVEVCNRMGLLCIFTDQGVEIQEADPARQGAKP